ncbi:Protein HID1 [Dissostichus eleginoides]|uniref:Protein HID1 n=1 Tax=Dissostichus eleginoides TaxID=100907 RepID=A0AAD9BE00_DISEL|nr:Protein HID1 [Dissostichus eleginoides]
MGNADTKLHFRKAVIQLTTKTQPVEATDDAFWDQFWADTSTTVQDVFALVPAAEIRAVREESPSNLATLCYKAVERLVQGADSGCPSEKERQIVLNCARLLTRILPYIFEDADWRGFFWSTVPGAGRAGHLDEDGIDDESRPLAESLLLAISDLLFCPDFTAQSHKKNSPDTAQDIRSIDSCEYIWEAGVGFAQSPPLNYIHDINRTELLKLLLTCLSEAMYLPPSSESKNPNPWQLVEQAVQILIVTLEHEAGSATGSALQALDTSPAGPDNLFVNYLSRIHREEDLSFILKGLGRLMNNPLVQTYLPRSTKKIQFHQELLILFWKFCDFNKKFLFFVLKSSDVLDVLVPILFSLNDARADPSRVGLMHIGVFIVLLLSGERNFGVRLNKPFTLHVPMDIPIFTGTHADLLIVIFHKITTSGHQRLQPLFDCLLTIIVNISPYLKSLSMVAANKLLHLLEAFTTPWFLFSSQENHHLVFFLLEVFNNIIQYQFDGNSNLVYAIIRKRNVFHQLANLPSDTASIQRVLQKKKKSGISRTNSTEAESIERIRPADSVEPGTLKASLVATPGIDKITAKSQVSVDGTMITVPTSDSPADTSAVGGASDTESNSERDHEAYHSESEAVRSRLSSASSSSAAWSANTDWVLSWKAKLPLQTIMRLLQVLVPQVEKICIDKGLTDESEILKFLQHGTLVGLLPVPHPILIRKYQANAGTAMWFRTYMWGVIYLRNVDPPIWYDTDIRLFEIQRI